MLTSIFGRLRELRTPIRSLLYLYFIYEFTSMLTVIFMQIAVFKMFSDISTNIIGVMLSFTGAMIGFCVFGYIVSHYRLDAKQGFYYSFISFSGGLLILSQASTETLAYLALFIYGLGSGFFWLTVHTYELTETKDEERDFYSSVLSSGTKLISILSPLCATALLWISTSVLQIGSFTLLFTITPFIYLLGLFCFKGLQTYRPVRIDLADFRHFFSEKRNLLAQIYIGAGGSQHILGHILMPLILLYILGTELNVSIYSTLAGGFTIILVLILGQYRNKGNRIFLFGISALGISLLGILLGFHLSLPALIIFTIGTTILHPIMEVSDHVISLQTMESIGREGRDFYATMILRDFSLWVWRMVAGVLLLWVASILPTKETLSVGIYILSAVVVLTFIGAKLLVEKMKLTLSVADNK